MQYAVTRKGEVMLEGIAFPHSPLMKFLNGLVDQGLVEEGDFFETESSAIGTLQYLGDRKWKAVVTGGR